MQTSFWWSFMPHGKMLLISSQLALSHINTLLGTGWGVRDEPLHMRSQEQVGMSPHCAHRVRWGCGSFQTIFPREQNEAEWNMEEREAQVVYTKGDRWAIQALEAGGHSCAPALCLQNPMVATSHRPARARDVPREVSKHFDSCGSRQWEVTLSHP